MATRYSGDLKINVTYRDRGDYAATVALQGHNAWKGTISPPAMGFGRGIAYDSPEAYDSVARAALSFAENEGAIAFEDGMHTFTGWHVVRSKHAAHG